MSNFDARDHAMKQNVLQESFGWEVPVDSIPLPSAGLIYHPDSRLYNRSSLDIKAMTAHEEDILSSQALIKNGTVIDQLIKSCLIDKKINVEELISGDKTALMVAIRITGYGADYHAKSSCESCNHGNDVVIDLSDLEIKRLKIAPITEGENKFKYTLPVSKKEVIFKFLSLKELKERDSKKNFYKNNLKMTVENNVTSFIESSIISIDGITDRHKISQFVKNMPALDSRKLRLYIDNHEPGVDMTHSFKCASCGHITNSSIPITSEFFWPTT